jgi:hypothetical protein
MYPCVIPNTDVSSVSTTVGPSSNPSYSQSFAMTWYAKPTNVNSSSELPTRQENVGRSSVTAPAMSLLFPPSHASAASDNGASYPQISADLLPATAASGAIDSTASWLGSAPEVLDSEAHPTRPIKRRGATKVNGVIKYLSCRRNGILQSAHLSDNKVPAEDQRY